MSKDELREPVNQETDAPEPAASRTTPEMAQEINSDVRVNGKPVEPQPSEAKDVGTGNTTAPRDIKDTANDPDGKKGRVN